MEKTEWVPSTPEYDIMCIVVLCAPGNDITCIRNVRRTYRKTLSKLKLILSLTLYVRDSNFEEITEIGQSALAGMSQFWLE